MKYLFALGALLSLGLTSASGAMDKQINDEVGVSAVVHGFEDAWNRHDMDAFAKLFGRDEVAAQDHDEKSAWGSDNPTKAAFPFLHGHALAEAGHTVQIFLLGEAVSLMRLSLAKAVVPVGWPSLVEWADRIITE